MSYLVSLFAAFTRPSMGHHGRRYDHTSHEEMLALYYSPISPRLT